MKEAFHPDFIFGSTVAGGNNKPSSNPYNQLETMIMRKRNTTYPKTEGMDDKIYFPTVSLLEF